MPRVRMGASVVYHALATGEGTAGTGEGASCAGGAGAEAVLLFDLPVASRLEAETGDLDVISLRREGSGACDGEELACGSASLEVASLDPGRYVLVLHRDGASAGAVYEVSVVATPQ